MEENKLILSMDNIQIDENTTTTEFYTKLLEANDLDTSDKNIMRLDDLFLTEEILLEMSDATKSKIKSILKKLGLGITIGALTGMSASAIVHLTKGAISGGLATAISKIGMAKAAGIGAGAGVAATGAKAAIDLKRKRDIKREETETNESFSTTYSKELLYNLLEDNGFEMTFNNYFRLNQDLKNQNCYINEDLKLIKLQEFDSSNYQKLDKRHPVFNWSYALLPIVFGYKSTFEKLPRQEFIKEIHYNFISKLFNNVNELQNIKLQIDVLLREEKVNRHEVKKLYVKYFNTFINISRAEVSFKSYVEKELNKRTGYEFKYVTGDPYQAFRDNARAISIRLTLENYKFSDVPTEFIRENLYYIDTHDEEVKRTKAELIEMYYNTIC